MSNGFSMTTRVACQLGDLSLGAGPLKLLGWLLTAAAGTLGAGYWFGLLTKAINIRGTGPKPVAKSGNDNSDSP